METDARTAAVDALVVLARSPDHRDRADAGQSLASFAEISTSRVQLVDLVLADPDTLVTRLTAAALSRRRDALGWSALAAALHDADDNHADWIQAGIDDGLGPFPAEIEAAISEAEPLLQDPDDAVRRGASVLLELLGGTPGETA